MSDGLLRYLRRHGLFLAWVVSLIATGGSLFLSEIMHYIPCNLCWFQRMFMYPIVILLGRASFKNDHSIIGYVLPLSIIGGSISMYHYAEQKIPALAKMLPCTVGVPCHLDYLNWFGFITIPLLAMIAFLLITLLLLISKKGLES
ncbi:disulfide oxidoreductase [Paenibacillus thermotolerans]|uniref:disulfide oxidoreductase n=1 Tax=Paenibacillus thermotolerans TaxID=3027807 RepID=UPI002367FDA5|nr:MULTISPECIES: disulfide oxidoreductase [unclassified Paenibacillus]